ncbi:MAG: ribonuclease J [Hyphomicrobiales bacterium]|nr:ribonuclease J [Hyphomicrobiales bacterium]MCP5372859.1 ribonuclease J [Hyphomicrobiales bacterium]
MTAAKKELCFLPLGGAGEIGMNLNLYGFGAAGDEDWVMVDLGVTFGSGAPGIDVIMPDPAFIEERRDRLLGLVLTHAHEDHLGAVPYLWPRLECPVYATPFTASVLRRKLAEVDLLDRVPIHEVPLKGRMTIGPFDMELITLTHSIPEPNGIAIRTPAGAVLHTGDWKFDPDPVIGEAADEDALRRLGDEGVLAIVCDSTNVFSPGDSGSEADLLPSLTELIAGCEGRVAVACFATNVARLETIARAAQANDRDVVLAGRSLERISQAAMDNGYLDGIPAFLDESMAGYLPRDKCLIVCTGSQGEPRAALARIASGEHPRVDLEAGDTVIFSSREIPGNEYAIGRMQNMLIRRGVRVVTPRDHFVHVSGHPARDELTRMYQLARPRVSVPVHGELRHLVEHAALARTCQVSHAVVAENGAMVRLDPDAPGVVDHVPAGRLVLEGNRVVPIQGDLVRERSRALFNGTAFVSVAVNAAGDLVGEPHLSTVGLVEEGEHAALDAAARAARAAVRELGGTVKDDAALAEAVRIAVRRVFRDSHDKRPVTKVHLIRV